MIDSFGYKSRWERSSTPFSYQVSAVVAVNGMLANSMIPGVYKGQELPPAKYVVPQTGDENRFIRPGIVTLRGFDQASQGSVS